jgi:hypothetical protein
MLKTRKMGGVRSYDGQKQLTGHKRHIAVDFLGLVLAVVDNCSHPREERRPRLTGEVGL